MTYPDDFINKVIQGDCLEVMKQMPDKCVDLVVTDPPYGINVGKPIRERESNFATVGIKGASTPKSYRGFDDSRIPAKEYFDEMIRISKNQVIFGGNYFVEYLKNSSCMHFSLFSCNLLCIFLFLLIVFSNIVKGTNY